MRAALAMLALAVVAGCTAPAPTIDPLFGRSTVPPPRPGETIAERPGEPYYSGAANAAGPIAGVNVPGTTPPGGRFERTNVASRTGVAGRAGISGGTAGRPASSVADEEEDLPEGVRPRRLRSTSPEESPVRSRPTIRARSADLPGANSTAAAMPTTARPRSAALPRAPVRSVPLQPASARITQQSGAFRTASLSAVPAAATVSGPISEDDDEASPPPARTGGSARRVTAAVSNRYGYDPDYVWLRGRLEYFQATDRWKLRYIPIDGETDEFGGSVVLDATQLLDDYQSGDFVAVDGELSGEARGSQAFAPRYRVDRIEPAGG